MNATGTPFAIVAELSSLPAAERALLMQRGQDGSEDVARAVAAIIADVGLRGDDALRDLAARFDGVRLQSLEVPRARWNEALAALDQDVRAALGQAAHNIERFHRAQLPVPMELDVAPGVRLGRRPDPLRRVGVYAPGGRAAYPSSVLMGVVPARVAGVEEIIVCSPPGRDGVPSPAVLAACALAGADRVFALGGAGAIAALALGTDAVPRVDRVVGPGNAFVTEAKRQLTRVVAIDSPAGPSEILVLADDSADPTLVAAELIAQAEHDPDAACVLVATDPTLCPRVAGEVERLLDEQPRSDIIRAALAARGALLVASDMAQAVRFAEEFAPEHLLVLTRDPRALLPALRAAGTIFLGAPSSVAFGDYITGANHVLPTGGLARSYAGLSTLDFLRWTTYQELTPAAAAALAGPTAALAIAESLPAHALAARLRTGVQRSGRPGGPGSPPSGVGRATAVPLRAAYAGLRPYDPGRAPCPTDLSDNTNLFGPPPAAMAALATFDGAAASRYPSVYGGELKDALAERLGVAAENIVTGCGSDDVIDAAVRAFCEPGDTVAHPVPTFGMVPVFAGMSAARPVPVPLAAGFELDADALIDAGARVTYLCRPNNPTGNAFDRGATERVCRDAAGVVLVDEAYADFADDDFVAFARDSARTVVLRTFSKAWGLAGLRVGYAVGPAALVAEIEKARGPYKLGAAASAAALAALARDGGWVRERSEQVRANRARLRSELEARGVTTWPTAANFVLLEIAGAAQEWSRRLRELGVAVRPFPALPGAGECLRVTVGPWPMMERFLAAVDALRPPAVVTRGGV